MDYVIRYSWVLTPWERQWELTVVPHQWCSGLLCDPDAHPGMVLVLSRNTYHRNSIVSHYFPFHDEQKSVTHKHFLMEYVCH